MTVQKDRRKYKCPNGCEVNEFVVPPCCIEVYRGDSMLVVETGVTVTKEGDCTNRWADGMTGVPDDMKEDIEDHIAMGCPPHCPECWEEATLKKRAKGRRNGRRGEVE